MIEERLRSIEEKLDAFFENLSLEFKRDANGKLCCNPVCVVDFLPDIGAIDMIDLIRGFEQQEPCVVKIEIEEPKIQIGPENI